MRVLISLMAVAVLLVPEIVFGQAFTGSISGIVTDPSGALMGDVPVVITDLDKNTTFRTASNQTGFYIVSSLAPGNYLVQAEKEGFHRFSLSGLPLSTQQKATVNIQFQVGTLAESVTVSGEAQLLEASTATLSAVVGDTPTKEVLRMIRDWKYRLPALLEYEYKGGNTLDEVKRCRDYVKQALA